MQFNCEHLVSVAGPHGQKHHIAFNPTPETVKSAFEWQESGAKQEIEVEDRAGKHVRRVAACAIKVVYDYGSLVVTTDG